LASARLRLVRSRAGGEGAGGAAAVSVPSSEGGASAIAKKAAYGLAGEAGGLAVASGAAGGTPGLLRPPLLPPALPDTDFLEDPPRLPFESLSRSRSLLLLPAADRGERSGERWGERLGEGWGERWGERPGPSSLVPRCGVGLIADGGDRPESA